MHDRYIDRDAAREDEELLRGLRGAHVFENALIVIAAIVLAIGMVLAVYLLPATTELAK